MDKPKRTLIADTTGKIGKKVTLFGWVDTIRDHGKIAFIDLRDRTGKVQCVLDKLPKISTESVVEVEGMVAKRPEKLINPNIETGEIEIQINEINVISSGFMRLNWEKSIKKLFLVQIIFFNLVVQGNPVHFKSLGCS